MTVYEYIKNHTKEAAIDGLNGEKNIAIVSKPNECYLTLKSLRNSWHLITFLAEHSIINLESTFNDSNNKYKVANIGFSKTENKWYGWSHRAIFGFGIGSKVKKGDCAYKPIDKEDYIEDSIRFWEDSEKINLHTENITEDGFDLVWTYGDNISNKDLRGTENRIYEEFPKAFGRGEWEAKTLEDAKQMAIDFANAIS